MKKKRSTKATYNSFWHNQKWRAIEHSINTGDFKEAYTQIDMLDCMEATNTQVDPDSLNQLASYLLRSEDWDAAIVTLGLIEQRLGLPRAARIDRLFHAAAQAALSHDYIRSAELHCRLLALYPKHQNGLRNFAIVLRRLRAYSAAERYILNYIEIFPECIHGLNTYGTILADLGRNREAIEIYKRILAIDPDYPDANSNLANEYHLLSQIDLSFIYSSRALCLSASNSLILLDHLTQLRRVCAFDQLEKVDWWQLLEEINPNVIDSSFLQVLTLAESSDDQRRFLGVVRRWGKQQASVASRQTLPLGSVPISDRFNNSIRIGFVSADFRDHSVARFIWPLFEHLNREEFSLYCYSTYRVQDSWRKRFEQHSSAMRDVSALSPLAMKKVISKDNIDILFDLTGFTKGSRTSFFAWRAANIQISWLGFPGTSGIDEIDYLFLDRYLVPEDLSLIQEQPLITPGTTVCFSNLDEIPLTPVIPEIVRGHLTLGTLNNSYKITRATISRWAKVLLELPRAHFLFVRREFQSYYLRINIIDEFAKHGIESDRIHFYNNRLDGRHYLDCYNEIDFTLDTYPVTGGTTTTDSLWMGVPVVALEGPNVHQRVCSAILQHAGHPEWIAKTDEEFIDIALGLAMDQDKRVHLRHSLRTDLKKSPLYNTKQFADDFGRTMRQLMIKSKVSP